MVERIFRQDLPTLGHEPRGEILDEVSVPAVQESSELRPMPPRRQSQVDLQGSSDPASRTERQLLETPTLRERDVLLVDTSSLRHVLLTPAMAPADRPKDGTHLLVGHPVRMPRGASLPVERYVTGTREGAHTLRA